MDQKVNDMLERMKIAAQQTAQAVGKAADVAGKKTNELVSTTKASLQIFDLNSEIDGLLKEIGRCVYMAHTRRSPGSRRRSSSKRPRPTAPSAAKRAPRATLIAALAAIPSGIKGAG